MSRIEYPCPNCGFDGPHESFALNEYECASCYAEFSGYPEQDEIDAVNLEGDNE